jgi:hypothetical protein
METPLRIARPTNRLEELARMYESGLNLTRIGEFRNHDGFDGIILGVPGLAWHLEFTQEQGVAAGGAGRGVGNGESGVGKDDKARDCPASR